MAFIRKRNNKWVAEIRIKGVSRAKTFLTKIEAQRWALDYEQQLGKKSHIVVTHTVSEAMDRYAREVCPTRKGRRWEIIRLNKLKRDRISSIALTDLTREDMQDWIDRQTTAPNSVHRDLTLIATVLREARIHWKWISENPLAELKRPKKPAPRDRLITPDELKRLMLALEYDEQQPIVTMRQEIAVAFLLALETAMRQGELWGLDWARVFLDRKFVTLPDTKNGMRRDVALSPRAVELFKKLSPQKSGPVFKVAQGTAVTVFRRAVELAALPDFTFHDSRHSAITNLARKLDVLDLARMVGHRDIRSLQIYYNATAEDIAGRLA